ncbi:hypothetical protein BBO99_00005089 [Phytophthora kernoviae]|uniref:Tubby C-terminal domain-containing protein n=2 Tax=Phytophthora kernoviae TaxID=325452 RepID=A0A3F2RJG8_9STRA|nr:hypothetical protein G195_005548 [Phytophthora kernoviae 00238/432]KAG2523532.1 hypothetical protein JM16_004798 [Phytophthora kernoviae]KAG2525372.1 hypothetical protein JM18_004411 [Phytophthora kernoviae]RLN21434.1 hypothetical protein BBI17_005176 [Phytophthora kernoviae]RLN54494.1 hypothetical protein BBJ29_002328 [Phytophthora kernoviae]
MGTALSMQKFLATPLAAQWKFPFVVNPRFSRRRVTTLALTDNFWTHTIDIGGYAIREAESGRILFRVMPAIDGEPADGRTKWLLDEYGIAVAHLTPTSDSNTASYKVYLGKRRQSPRVLTTLEIKFVPGRGQGGRREPIAKVYRPASNRMTTFGGNGYHVETAIGVDMALIILICAAMDDASVHFHKAHKHPILGTSGIQ